MTSKENVYEWLNEWLEVYLNEKAYQDKQELISSLYEINELKIKKIADSIGIKNSNSMLNDIRIKNADYMTHASKQPLRSAEVSTQISNGTQTLLKFNSYGFRRITVREYLDKNLLSFYPKASERTKHCYVTASKTIVKLIGNLYLDELTRSNLQNTLNSLSSCSQSKIDKVRLVMKKMVEMAVEDNLISKNVAVKVFSPKTKQIDNRSEDEKVYIKTQLAEILWYAKQEKDPQLFTILTILAFTGIRPGELRGLEKRDVHFDTKELTIRQAATNEPKLNPNQALASEGPRKPVIGLTKSLSGVRTLFLGDEIIAVIQKWIDYLKNTNPVQYESKLLFPNSKGKILRDDVLNLKFNRFKKRHGLDKKFKLYRFRHTFCTNLFHEKMDLKTVQKLMGDSTVDVILKVYAHVLDDDTKRAGEEINDAYVKMLPDLFTSDHTKNTVETDETSI